MRYAILGMLAALVLMAGMPSWFMGAPQEMSGNSLQLPTDGSRSELRDTAPSDETQEPPAESAETAPSDPTPPVPKETTVKLLRHETGAVEGTGHKCIALQSRDGRISASQISVAAAMLDDNEHVAKPAMVYISMSTELGTVYNRAQLRDIYLTCQQLGLYLFIDGARLGYALAAPTGDLTAADIAEMCDVFTVGGTKMGALFGEAIVINHPALKKHFRHMMKHQGGLLAKGWLLGVQFSALMADGLYFQLGQKAVKQAMRIRTALLEKGIPLHVDSPTNQLFPIFSDEQVETLEEDFALEFQERVDESHVVLRVCTSWATPERNVTAFIEKINKL